MGTYLPIKSRPGRVFLIAFSLLVALFIVSAGYTYANSVTISDQSGVLNIGKVRSDAAQLPVSVLIYTTRTFTGDQAALDNDARSHLLSANAVDIAIDTVQRHLSIQSGSQVKLSDEQASNAVDAFKNNFDNGDYTGATIAAIDSIHDALTNESSGGGMTVVGIVVASVLGVIFLGIIVGVVRNRRRGGPPRGGGRRWGNQEWNRGYYPYPVSNNSGSNSNYGGGASGNFGGGGFGGGAGGSFGGGAGGSF